MQSELGDLANRRQCKGKLKQGMWHNIEHAERNKRKGPTCADVSSKEDGCKNYLLHGDRQNGRLAGHRRLKQRWRKSS